MLSKASFFSLLIPEVDRRKGRVDQDMSNVKAMSSDAKPAPDVVTLPPVVPLASSAYPVQSPEYITNNTLGNGTFNEISSIRCIISTNLHKPIFAEVTFKDHRRAQLIEGSVFGIS